MSCARKTRKLKFDIRRSSAYDRSWSRYDGRSVTAPASKRTDSRFGTAWFSAHGQATREPSALRPSRRPKDDCAGTQRPDDLARAAQEDPKRHWDRGGG